MAQELIQKGSKTKPSRLGTSITQAKHQTDHAQAEVSKFTDLQDKIGNRALQRLLAQRSDEGPTDLDDDTANRINQARGGGQSLDTAVQKQMSQATGHDFSGVRVHTSPESNDLNQQLNAKAFTTGQDIFFREGAYDPQSGGGQELIAHELTHVVQQSSGAVSGSGSGVTVNAPGDAFEQEADAVAKQVVHGGHAGAGADVQRQPEEEDELQRQDMPEEEENVAQMQAEEEEDLIQQQGLPEEEEETLG